MDKAEEQERRFWWHWQNLRKDEGSRDWLNGRAWFYLWRTWTVGVQWVLTFKAFKLGYRFQIDRDGEDPIGGSIHLGFASLYWHVSPPFKWVNARLPRWFPNGETEAVLYSDPWAIHLQAWSRPDEWRRDDPWWRKTKVIDLRDFILGSATYSEHVTDERAVVIPMPEGCYDATAKLCEASWTRRFGWVDRQRRIHLDVPAGIPHDGKGENDYDCGEDRTFGLTTNAHTIEDGVGKLVASVLHDRKRYGGHRAPVVMAPVPAKEGDAVT